MNSAIRMIRGEGRRTFDNILAASKGADERARYWRVSAVLAELNQLSVIVCPSLAWLARTLQDRVDIGLFRQARQGEVQDWAEKSGYYEPLTWPEDMIPATILDMDHLPRPVITRCFRSEKRSVDGALFQR